MTSFKCTLHILCVINLKHVNWHVFSMSELESGVLIMVCDTCTRFRLKYAMTVAASCPLSKSYEYFESDIIFLLKFVVI